MDEVYHPGLGEDPAAGRFGHLYQFHQIDIGGVIPNQVDAALAAPDDPNDLDPDILGIGAIAGVGPGPTFFDELQKVGWATHHTTGTYVQSATFLVPYLTGFALFENQLGVVGLSGDFSARGDSGAAVLNVDNEIVGMQFAIASGINLSYVNRIDHVQRLLAVEVVTS